MPNVNFAKKAVLKVQKRSAFDKSFRNLLTTKCGTLTPLLCDEVMANTTVNLKLAISATLPPLASETFMNVNLKAEAFFIPGRLVMNGYTDFMMGNTDLRFGNTTASTTDVKLRVPVVEIDPTDSGSMAFCGPGTLADYLGFRVGTVSSKITLNALPFICYNLVYDEWYRNSLVQGSCFDADTYELTSPTWTPAGYKKRKPLDSASVGYKTVLKSTMRDGVAFGALRQRNFGSDYFTTATPQAQRGSAQKVSMRMPSVFDSGIKIGAEGFEIEDTSINSDNTLTGNDGSITGVYFADGNGDPVNMSFTIASLRAANSLQIWLERQNLANSKWVDYLKVNFNADLKDSIAQRPVYLGSASFPVYSKGVYQTAADSNSGNNPFDSVGSRYGHAYAEGTDFIIDHYTAEEPGYIMVLVSVVPEVTYSSGVNKYLLRYRDADSYGEMANAILQNVGAEPIRKIEFNDTVGTSADDEVFGYTDRFGSWMTRNHELHGLLRDGQSLESFALQRSGITQGINTSFLQIPTNYMDQVTAVDSAISNYGCWIDAYLDYKVVQPLAEYSLPSLQDPAYEHGDTVVVNKRGRIME